MTIHLKAAIERALEPKGDTWGGGGLHVSDLSVAIPGQDGKCPRQLWLRLQGAETQPWQPGKELMFAAGHRLHAACIEWLKAGLEDGWSVLAEEMKLDKLLPDGLTGTCDCVLLGPGGTTVVVDFKTVRGQAFKFLDAPKPANVLQVQTYCYALKAHYGKLLYVDREGQNFAREFTVDRDDAAVEAAIGAAKRIEGLPEPPPILEPVTKRGKLTEPWQCSYCEYRDVSCPGAMAFHEEQTLVAQLEASVKGAT